MSVHAKEHPTDGVAVLTIVGPAHNKAKIVKAAKSLGFVETEDAVPWEVVFPNFTPADALVGARYKEDLTQRELAEMTGIPHRHISEMERGRRTIGKEQAKLLAKALNVSCRVFL
jgi:ribosome-binding protein aMBF1 (putative translation factor)